MQNVTALFASAAKGGAHSPLAAAGALSFEQRATLAESAELQTRTNYLRTALQLHNPGKAFSMPALLAVMRKAEAPNERRSGAD